MGTRQGDLVPVYHWGLRKKVDYNITLLTFRFDVWWVPFKLLSYHLVGKASDVGLHSLHYVTEQQDDRLAMRVPPFGGHATRKRALGYLSRAIACTERWRSVRKTLMVAVTIAAIGGSGRESRKGLT